MKLKKVWWQSLLLLGGLIIFDFFLKSQTSQIEIKTKMTKPNLDISLATPQNHKPMKN